MPRTADDTEPAPPQPSRTTPWPDPAPIRPVVDPRHTPDPYVDAVGDIRGAHLGLTTHLRYHPECGQQCPDFVELFDAIGTALDSVRPATLRAVA